MIEFDYHAAERRKRRGQGKPETFNFLGFHAFLWEVPDPANFGVRRVAMAKRLRVASQAIKTSLLRHLHRPSVRVRALAAAGGSRLLQLSRGAWQLPVASFRTQVADIWVRVLRCRS